MKRLLSITIALMTFFSISALAVFAADELNVREESNSNGTVTVAWDLIADATYDVLLDGNSVASMISETEYSFTGLKSGERHTITVNASNGSSGTVELTVNEWIESPKGLVTAAGYNASHLYWDPVPGAVKYRIFKSVGNNSNFKEISNPVYRMVTEANLKGVGKTATAFKFTDKNEGIANYYKVVAVGASGVNSQDSAIVQAGRVRGITYYVTLKTSKSLKSHDGKGKRAYFKKGTTLAVTGFGGGKYKFYYKGGYFYVNMTSTKNAKAQYVPSGSWNYSRLSAQNYINDRKIKSRTGYLIWSNLYTQHTYLFVRKNGTGPWECYYDFEVSSGAARLPSPSGSDRELIIGRGTENDPGKRKSRHNRKWWSPYSSWNSYHSKLPKQGLGFPASKGCLRCYEHDAKRIYDLPRKTRVVIV